MSVTVDLDDNTLDALQAEADRRGIAVDVVVAESVREHLESAAETAPATGHRFGFVGIIASGDGRLSQDYKAIRRDAFADKNSHDL